MRKSLLIFLLTFYCQISFSQDSTFSKYPTELNKGKLYKTIAFETAFYLGGNAYLQYIWYNDHARVPFHFYNDNAGYLQIDKMGHAYAAYNYSVSGYEALREAGVSKKKALIYGGPLGLFLQTPIEIFDGLYEGWGFSWGDMVANTAGSALVVGNELLFDEQLIKYKFTYSSSMYRKVSNGHLGNTALEGFLYDYNAHSYWLSVPIHKIISNDKIPDWLCISAGYSANGMFGEFENDKYYRGKPLPNMIRYRQFLLSLDIDWSKIETNSKFLKKLLNTISVLKLPFPTFEIASTGKIRGYWIYY